MICGNEKCGKELKQVGLRVKSFCNKKCYKESKQFKTYQNRVTDRKEL